MPEGEASVDGPNRPAPVKGCCKTWVANQKKTPYTGTKKPQRGRGGGLRKFFRRGKFRYHISGNGAREISSCMKAPESYFGSRPSRALKSATLPARAATYQPWEGRVRVRTQHHDRLFMPSQVPVWLCRGPVSLSRPFCLLVRESGRRWLSLRDFEVCSMQRG